MGLLIAAACTVPITACGRQGALPRPPAGHMPAAISAAEGQARREAPSTTVEPATTAVSAWEAATPRQVAYLATSTPLPRPTPTATPTVAPPTPVIPRAQTPPTELVIPSIDLRAPVVPMSWREAPGGEVTWDDPGASVGWMASSSLPGEGSNVVLAGHHNIRGEVFRYLVDVTPGAEVLLTTGDVTYRYEVRERFIVPEKYVSEEQKEQNALWIAPTIDERLTMLTCWPYRDNTHRLIVIAAPMPFD